MKEKICCPRRLHSDIITLFLRKQHRDTFEVAISCLLQADGRSGFNHSTARSPSSISHFLNEYDWSLRGLIRIVRRHMLDVLKKYQYGRRGRPPMLELIVDTTSIAKEGKFEGLEGWMHTLNSVRGVHIVLLYVCCGELRLPWSFAIWRGKGTPSPAELALRLVRQLPLEIRKQSKQVHLLADAGFGTENFIKGVVGLGLEATIGMRADRLTTEGKHLNELTMQEKRVQLKGLEGIDLWVYWVWLPAKKAEERQKRYIVSTRWRSVQTACLTGRRRWKIEALFKTLKSRFAFGKFAQKTKLGVLRYLCLSLLCFILSHFEDLSNKQKEQPGLDKTWPDWGKLAKAVQHQLFGWVRLFEIRREEKLILSRLGQLPSASP